MPRFARIISPILLALVATLSAGTALAASEHVTAGEFVVAVAKAHDIQASDPAAAMKSLRAAGYDLPEVALDRPLTEGTVASIAGALGLNVTTRNPAAGFTRSQMDAFLASFGQEMSNRSPRDGSTNSNAADPLTKGIGKKKGLHKSQSEPS